MYTTLLNQLFSLPNSDIRYNTKETETSYELHLYVPGIDKEKLNLTCEHDVLNISYKNESQSENYRICQYDLNQFNKSFSLPDDIDHETIEAEYKDGILKVILNKITPTKPIQIKIK